MAHQSPGVLPRVKDGAHIGLLGGSFDPPHICHQLLALSFIALEPIDELWVIPCANHAQKSPYTDFAHRIAMCEIAFRRVDGVRILDLENHLNAPSYTIHTIDFIREHAPTINLHFGIGSDLVNSFSSWHKSTEIADKARIVIFERSSYPVKDLPTVLDAARIHRGYALPDINSTSLRDFSRRRNPNDPLAHVDRDVVRYIDQHELYR